VEARHFLERIEHDLIQRYKYIAIYLQDFVRVCVLSFFLKKPTFLVNFIAFQIAKLPKNRKETTFIRFLIKFIKIFAAQRSDKLNLKVVLIVDEERKLFVECVKLFLMLDMILLLNLEAVKLLQEKEL
jgi:hypothetical protein